MATIDLIVSGMLKKESSSAYDTQKLVEYRNISKWVKISTFSIYKKVIRLEEKGYTISSMVKESRMAGKAVYSLTEQGNGELEHLIEEIASKLIHIFLDLNAVIVSLDSVTSEKQKVYLEKVEDNIKTLKVYLEEDVSMREGESEIPRTDMAVLKQQQILAFVVEGWIREVKRDLFGMRQGLFYAGK